MEEVEERLKGFGTNTIQIEEAIFEDQKKKGINEGSFYYLKEYGELQTLKKMRNRTQIKETNERVDTYFYTIADLPTLSFVESQHLKDNVFLLHDTLPQNFITRCLIEGSEYRAKVINTSQLSFPIKKGVVMSESLSSTVNKVNGYVNLYFFKDSEKDPSIPTILQQLSTLITLDARQGIKVKDPLKLIEQAELLELQQIQVRGYLLIGVSIALAIILGVISLLEMNENVYVFALLKSLGFSSLPIWLRGVIENVVLTNLVLIILVSALPYFAERIAASLDLSNLDSSIASFFQYELFWIALMANVGALISGIPSLGVLGKPIGKVLN